MARGRAPDHRRVGPARLPGRDRRRRLGLRRGRRHFARDAARAFPARRLGLRQRRRAGRVARPHRSKWTIRQRRARRRIGQGRRARRHSRARSRCARSRRDHGRGAYRSRLRPGDRCARGASLCRGSGDRPRRPADPRRSRSGRSGAQARIPREDAVARGVSGSLERSRARGRGPLPRRPRLLLRLFTMAKALPIIDLSSWSGGGAAAAEVAKAIGAACRDVGFFYVVGHGVPTTLMDEAFAHSRRFFALPLADKQAIAIETVGGNRGYSALLHEALDPTRGPDLKEAFNVGFELQPDDPEFLAGKPFRSLNAWPRLAGFRETMLAYYDACAGLGARLHQAFAGDLGVAPDFFADKFDRPMATLRLLRYPAAAQERVGAGEHTDYGNLTLLATDDVGGLEVRTRAGDWIEAPPRAGAFIVNIGDCLMRWTNDVYVSTPHRVVNRSARERTSIAFFFDPNPEAEVAAIASCVGSGEVWVRGRNSSPRGPGREPAGPSRVADFGAQALEKARPATDSPIASKACGLARVEAELQVIGGEDQGK